MAVSPKQCIEHVTAADKLIVERYEQKIDHQLLGVYSGGTSFQMTIYEKINSRIQSQLRDLYRSAGWSEMSFTESNYNDPREPGVETKISLIR